MLFKALVDSCVRVASSFNIILLLRTKFGMRSQLNDFLEVFFVAQSKTNLWVHYSKFDTRFGEQRLQYPASLSFPHSVGTNICKNP